ncbi:MAG: DNA topoisomerase [Thermofilaceae archaeon]
MMWFDAIVVAEKPGVARAFAAYLSQGRYASINVAGVSVLVFKCKWGEWAALGIRGHLMNFDFPKKYSGWKNVDPIELFRIAPIRMIREGMVKYVNALSKLAISTELVILALDADIEGEAIAFEVMHVMRKSNPHLKFSRIWFSAVTKDDILDALSKPRDPDPRLANKAFARMVLDLVIGASFTRTLTLMVERNNGNLPRGKFLSYGPCQTPVLYLVVKRALERENFKKKKYYQLIVTLETSNYKFKAKYEKNFELKDEAEALAVKLRKAEKAMIIEFDNKIISREPPEPLATVELERRASRFLDTRPKIAMALAEDLYQEGLISYPRTDTTIYPPTINLRAIASMFLHHEELGEYVSQKILSQSKLSVRQGKDDDKAHPPIHPLKHVNAEKMVKRFGVEGWKLYDLVVRHFLATLSPPLKMERQLVKVEIDNCRFIAEGVKILDYGYTLVYYYEKPQEKALPELSIGEQLKVLNIETVERETEPPPYLSESELLRLMRYYGIGTDATMQDHIHTNIERKYFEIQRKSCIPTPLGRALIKALDEAVPEAILPEIRGKMESKLKSIADGSANPNEIINSVKKEFLEYLLRLKSAENIVVETLLEGVNAVYSKRSSGKSHRSKFRTDRI